MNFVRVALQQTNMKYYKQLTADINPKKDVEILGRLMKTPQIKKYCATRFACAAVALVILMYLNGGLLPKFLRQKIAVLKVGSNVNILSYFSGTENDGINIKWARSVNSMDNLERALYSSDVHMVEGNVMLRGQGTAQQELIPIMAMFPNTDGALTFDKWLNAVIKASSKGIMVNFQAMDAVELTLQKLKERKEEITFPVWLHADVHQGPWGGPPKVDPTRFLKIVNKMFPSCTISFGWTTGHHTDLSQSGYSWNMILDMYYTVHKLEIKNPLVYTIQASYLQNSVPGLKWLTDNTKGSLFIRQEPKDLEDSYHQSLMYFCYRFPRHLTFFDMTNSKLEMFIKENCHTAVSKIDSLVKIRDTVMFRPEAWVKMGFHMEPHSLVASSEAILLQSQAVYMLSKAKYKPSSEVKLTGRVQFVDHKKLQSETGRTGLSIFVRSSSYMDFENIRGIKCFIGLDGELKVESSNIPGVDFKKIQHMTPGSQNCYRFSVIDAGSEVVFTVTVQHDCFTLESAKPNDRVPAVVTVSVPATAGGLELEHPFIVKLDDSKVMVIIDELTVKYGS